jgi:hypothetical protein
MPTKKNEKRLVNPTYISLSFINQFMKLKSPKTKENIK